MYFKRIPATFIAGMFLPLILTACSPKEEIASEQQVPGSSQADTGLDDATDPGERDQSRRDNQDLEHAVEVVTTEYAIEAPDTLDQGWTRFKFVNRGNQEHFVAMYKLVEGKTIEDQKAEVAPVFQPLMEGLRSGELTKADIGPYLEEHTPDWGLQMTWVGGAGLLSPGLTTYATFRLDEAGTYLLECYVKAPDGQWHTLMGMLQQVEVTEQQSDMPEPAADWAITLGESGIDAPDEISPGKHTIKVNFTAKSPSFMPYDINLARLDDDVDLKEIIHWMDWSNVGGLRAPAPVEFLGGVEHMNQGKHGYMTVSLAPGRYLWISEVNAATMHQEFTVSE